MEVISTNLGQPVTIRWKGSEQTTGIYKMPQPGGIYLAPAGVRGDTIGNPKVHGDILKGCYLFSLEQYPSWKARYPSLDWDYGMFGENLTVAGLDEGRLWMGSRYRVGEALVRITTPREPCFKLGIRFGDQGVIGHFVETGFPGAYAEVVEAGRVKPGDSMELLDIPDLRVDIRSFFALLYAGEKDPELIRKALGLPWLPEGKKELLQKWLP